MHSLGLHFYFFYFDIHLYAYAKGFCNRQLIKIGFRLPRLLAVELVWLDSVEVKDARNLTFFLRNGVLI